jgi:hypothetical protein
MQKAAFIFLLLIQVFIQLHAQESLDLKGSVVDSTGGTLSGASVRLVVAHDSLTVLTRADGSFHFRIPSAGSLRLQVTMEGFVTFGKSYSVDPGKFSTILAPIVLKAEYKALASVTVIGARPIRIREDTVEFFADAYKVHPGDELEFLLKKFPGLQVMPDGTIMYQGRPVAKIMLNGRDFVGADIATVIRNLPADIVFSIQFIDDYGDKGRLTGVKTGESNKVLNIVLKDDRRDGVFGNVKVGAGTNSKYEESLFASAVKENRQLTTAGWYRDTSSIGISQEKLISVGYSDPWSKKWSGSGSVGVWGKHQDYGSTMTQHIFLPGSTLNLDQNSHTNNTETTLGATWSFENRPDANTLVRITPSLLLSKSSLAAMGSLSSSESDSSLVKTTKNNSTNTTTTNNSQIGTDLYIDKSYPHSRNRFSLIASARYSSQQQFEDQQAITSIQADSQKSIAPYHYLLHTPNSNTNLYARLTYYLPVGETGFFELGYYGNYTYAQNDKLAQQPDSSGTHLITIDSLTNSYASTILTNRFHTGYLTHSKNLNLNLALEIQPALEKGVLSAKMPAIQDNYLNLLPIAQFSYHIANNRKIGFDYNTTTQFPTIQQLEPITDLSNPQNPVKGNPQLKPSYTNSLKGYYEHTSAQPSRFPSFGIDIKYAVIQNNIVPAITHPHDTTAIIQSTTYSNVNGSNNLAAAYHLTLPSFWNKHLTITLAGDLGSMQAISLLDNNQYRTNTINWRQRLLLRLDIPDILEYDVSGGYQLSTTRYTAAGTHPTSFPAANWGMQGRNFFLKKWIFSYGISQFFTSGASGNLEPNAVLVNGSLQRQFLAGNRLTCRLSVNNLLDSKSGNSQIITPTSITQNQSALVGRYLLFSMILNFERFRK